MAPESDNPRTGFRIWLESNPLFAESAAVAIGTLSGLIAAASLSFWGGFSVLEAMGAGLLVGVLCGTVCHYLLRLTIAVLMLFLFVLFPTKKWYWAVATVTGAGSAAYGLLCRGYTWPEALLAAAVHGMLTLFLCEAVGGLVYLAHSAFGKSEQTP